MTEPSKNEYFELQQKWLGLFENSSIHWVMNTEHATRELNPQGNYMWQFFTHLDAFETNWNEAVSHTYTPNGNFAKVNAWKRTGDKSERREASALQEVYAFVLDLDRKSPNHPTAPEYTRDDLMEILKRERLPINYITETPGGWHMYMFVDPKDRTRIDKNMYSDIIESFAIRLDADNLKDMARVFRVPFSKYYGGGMTDAWHVKLFRVDVDTVWEYEFEEVTKPSEINLNGITFWTFEQLKQLHESIHEKVVIANTASDDRFFDKDWESANFVGKCNSIRIPELFEHLKNYPRMTPEGFEYPILVGGTRVAFVRTTWDGEVLPTYETDGYRYFVEKNCMHNFTPKYSIADRPRWEPFAFMLHWFWSNQLKTYEFFEKEFWLFRRTDKQDLYMSIEASRWVIDFTTKWVTYTVNTQTKSWPSTKIQRLMHADCFPKWIVRTTWNTGKSESPEENIYIILSSNSGHDILIPYHTDKRAFNKRHGTHGLQFIGDEVCMNDFYQAIWETAKKDPRLIPTFEYLWTNWFYEEGFLYWTNWFQPDGTQLHVSEIPGKYFGNSILEMSLDNKSYIDVSDFYQRLLALFPQRISLISFLTYLVDMAWVNFWDPVITKVNSTKIIPPLFLSGVTQSGKSTLNLLMKEWFGVNPNHRTVALKSITPQPLQQYCTDNVVLHLEEYTGVIRPDIGGIVRDIINKNSKVRGNADGSNSTFFFRSNLLIDGEQLPEEESVQNRMVIVPFFENDKKGTSALISETRKTSYLFDLIRKLYSNWNNVEKYYLDAISALGAAGFSSREKELYGFIYTMNTICWLATPDQLIESIRENTTALQSLGKSDPLDEILSEVIFASRITPTRYEPMNGAPGYLSVPIPYTILSRFKIKLIECTKKFPGAVRIENSCLILEEKKIDLIDKKIEKFSFRVLVKGATFGGGFWL